MIYPLRKLTISNRKVSGVCAGLERQQALWGEIKGVRLPGPEQLGQDCTHSELGINCTVTDPGVKAVGDTVKNFCARAGEVEWLNVYQPRLRTRVQMPRTL